MHFTPLHAWKGAARAEAVLLGVSAWVHDCTNTCSGSTGARQVFSAAATMEIISGREFESSVFCPTVASWSLASATKRPQRFHGLTPDFNCVAGSLGLT